MLDKNKLIVMKISGESLKDDDSPIAKQMLDKIVSSIKLLKNNKVVLVVGGGNLFRGRNNIGISSVKMDQIGMLGTDINAIALSSYLNINGIKTKAYSAFKISGILEEYSYDKVVNDLDNYVVVLGGGCGLVNYSTDLVTVQRAIELNADIILMAKNIDGVYDKNPKLEGAKKYDTLTFDEFLKIGLNDISNGIIDIEANVLLNRHQIPLYIYSAKNGSLENFLNNKYDGTIIK